MQASAAAEPEEVGRLQRLRWLRHPPQPGQHGSCPVLKSARTCAQTAPRPALRQSLGRQLDFDVSVATTAHDAAALVLYLGEVCMLIVAVVRSGRGQAIRPTAEEPKEAAGL